MLFVTLFISMTTDTAEVALWNWLESRLMLLLVVILKKLRLAADLTSCQQSLCFNYLLLVACKLLHLHYF